MRSFGSDNHSGVHPAVLKALEDANRGHTPAYGNDPVTAHARDLIRDALKSPDAEIFFVFTGTAANTLSIRAACRPYESVIACDIAHINEDECGAPEYISGSKILSFEHQNGKLPLSVIDELEINPHDPHRVLPRLLSITQASEVGTVYSLEEIKTLSEKARKRGLLTHMDGARMANAAVTLNCDLSDMVKGLDLLSLGGTKNGLLCAEAVVFLNSKLAEKFAFIRKQSMQLASKMRYLSCQFIPYFEENLWQVNARASNQAAFYLRQELAAKVPEALFPYPTEANEVFVILPEALSQRMQEKGPAYLWDKQTRLIRLVCSYDTTKDDVDRLLASVI